MHARTHTWHSVAAGGGSIAQAGRAASHGSYFERGCEACAAGGCECGGEKDEHERTHARTHTHTHTHIDLHTHTHT